MMQKFIYQIASWFKWLDPTLSQAFIQTEMFQAFVDNSPMLSYLKDANGKLMWTNKRFRERVPGVVIGDNFSKAETVMGFGTDAEKQRLKMELEVLQGNVCEYVAELVDPEGRLHYWQVLKFPVRIKGETLIGCKSFEITDRREAERKLEDSERLFQAFMDNSPMSAYVREPGGKFLWLNRSYYKGLRIPVENLEGMTLEAFAPPEVVKAQSDHDHRVVKGGVPVNGTVEIPAGIGRDGQHWMSLKFPVQIGGKVYVGGLALDTTALTLAQNRLKAYSVELERSNRELQEFASVAAHDLQEPLRKIRAFGDLLTEELKGALPDTASDYLARMQASAGRMQALIEDLLMYSRVNNSALEVSQVDLEEVLSEVKADLELAIQQADFTIECGPLPSLSGDATQLRQLFQNLVSNAVKFRSKTQKPVLRISALEEEGQVRLCFKDNGVGFGMKYVDKIFGIFQRLHSRDAYDGNGLGLAVCRKIAERHGGSIRAESAPGDGAAFFVVLPKMHLKGST